MDTKECYSKIAQDFSNTRYSIWKKVKEFLDNIPVNSLVGDIGCGNGKNMTYRNDRLRYIGLDACPEFVEICKKRGLDVQEGNILTLPYENNFFDSIICIAVIHHLKTRENRINAFGELIRVSKNDGVMLVYVWSINRYDETERRSFASKDEMVPYITNSGDVYYRYYHLYNTQELIDEITEACELFKFKVKYLIKLYCLHPFDV